MREKKSLKIISTQKDEQLWNKLSPNINSQNCLGTVVRLAQKYVLLEKSTNWVPFIVIFLSLDKELSIPEKYKKRKT